jgi:hypothetical protein
MGNLATSAQNSQKTVNQQVGVNGAGASGASASGNVGKGGAQAVGNGISLVFNTGNNKIAPTGGGSGVARTRNNGAPLTPAPAPAPAVGSGNNPANQASGNIAVQISQTDQGSVQAGATVSLAALTLANAANDALLQSNTNATTLAEHALQAGADVAAVAIPTYAAGEIASNAINPPTIIDSGGGGYGAPAPAISTGEILAGVGILAALYVFFGKKRAA